MTIDLLKSRTGLFQWFVPVVLFLVGMWSLPLAVLGPERSLLPGELGDTRFNNFILEHFHQYFIGNVKSYWDAPFMYPWPNVIAHSDNLLGTAPFYSAFRHFGFNRESAYQLWMLSLLTLNFWCCYLVLKAWSGRVVPSACGAFIFAFGIFSIAQFGHGQVYARFMIPVAFLFMWRALNTGGVLPMALTALAVAYQFYCGIYLGFLLVYGLFFLIVGHSIVFKDRPLLMTLRSPRGLLSGGACTVLFLMLLVPLMLPYLKVANTLGTREFHEVAASIPRPSSYFFAHPAALSWRDLSEHGISKFGEWWYHYLFVGALPWAMVLLLPVVLFNKLVPIMQRRIIGCIALAWSLSMVVCMDIGGFTLYRVVYALPGFSELRSLDRIIHIQTMYFILLLVSVISALPARGRSTVVAFTLLPLLVVLDNRLDVGSIKRFDKWEARDMVNAVQRHMTAQYDPRYEVIAYMPVLAVIDDELVHDRVIATNLTAMLAAQQLGIPIVNAYTGSYPGNYISFFDNMDPSSLQAWCAFNNSTCEEVQAINDLNIHFKWAETLSLQHASGSFVSVKKDGTLVTDRDSTALWETFRIIHFEGGRIALRTHLEKFVAAGIPGKLEISAHAPLLGDLGIFQIVPQEEGWFLLQTFNGDHVKAAADTGRLSATADPEEASRFRLMPLMN